MKFLAKVSSVLLIALSSGTLFADNDSSAIDSSQAASIVASSVGVVMRVPIDSAGRELHEATELRVINNSDSSTQDSNVVDLWKNGMDVSNFPQADSSTDSGDSSTRWGWNRWNRHRGWNNFHFNTWYRPTFFHHGFSYNYNFVNSYNFYNPYFYNGHNVWGHRYYYYNRFW